jgi:ABC-2 type transport system ATP-binding protein
MTVEGFLRFVAEVRGLSGDERDRKVEAAMEKCLLTPVRRQAIQTLSKGYRQRTGFAQAILHDPPVLVLDEPTEGLDPNQKHVVRGMIREMGREKTIILSTHILEEVEAICSRIIIISAGTLVADSTPAELKRRSLSYNAVVLEVAQPEQAVREVFKGLGGVARVDVLGSAGGFTSARLLPRQGQSIIGEVLAAARAKQWDIRNAATDDGRLDEVFRSLTLTADTTASAAREG